MKAIEIHNLLKACDYSAALTILITVNSRKRVTDSERVPEVLKCMSQLLKNSHSVSLGKYVLAFKKADPITQVNVLKLLDQKINQLGKYS